MCVDRGLNPSWAAIEQPNTKEGLQIRDRVRDGGLGQGKLSSRLGHAAQFNHQRKNLQLTQLYLPPSTTAPARACRHRFLLYPPSIFQTSIYDATMSNCLVWPPVLGP